MKPFIFTLLLFLLASVYAFYSCNKKETSSEKAIEQNLLVQIYSFTTLKNQLLTAAESKDVNEKQLQQLFRDTRLAYKKFEWAAEYYQPIATRFINGPPVKEVEIDGTTFNPAGLQVIENYLFPKYDKTKNKELIDQLKLLDVSINKYKLYFGNVDILNWQIFDATRQQIFRVQALGITDFDNPLLQNSLQESATSLESITKVLSYYTDGSDSKLIEQLTAAIHYLRQNNNFNSFNRAVFIADYGNPASISIANLIVALKIPVIRYNRLLNQDAKTLFDTNAYNVNAYSNDPSFFITDKKVALGKKLFADPILSGMHTRSCQSCHQPEKAFADGFTKNTVINSTALLRRNTPTLINAALQPAQFYDLRAAMLEDQVLDVVANKQEMHGSIKQATALLYKDKEYRRLFHDAFPKIDTAGIPAYEVSNAIGSYIRSLVMLNSRFDEYMRGNKAAMNQSEINGFNLFMGKAKCATCHYMPLFNGTLPPKFIRIESEVIGVPRYAKGMEVDTDMGRYNLVRIDDYKHSFKITTVRNAAQTAPYMHNGVFTTLEQVVDFYNKGGGAGMGLKVDNQTLAADKLNLSPKECGELVAFIKSLDSKKM
ncbi:cytochrome-c peroxidase [Mucilaginibacter sp. X5P1]|uniref:cytochrome-c peroxidase n=1 Tax=Mucilaginibacter sp. X5P1 TaxID=2723088 RepID=UPI0016123C31|nr:cytochrome c peroxidase [Mucilaginibacter sp. X5P1]MBB6138214.1 cytochrome c peroxidase [Mucilaginibacter sp. X5P1]